MGYRGLLSKFEKLSDECDYLLKKYHEIFGIFNFVHIFVNNFFVKPYVYEKIYTFIGRFCVIFCIW